MNCTALEWASSKASACALARVEVRQHTTEQMYAKDLKIKQALIADDMQVIVNRAKAEGNRGLTAEEREKWHKLEADHTALEDSIKIAEKTYNVVEDMASTPGKKITEVQAEALRDTYGRKSKRKVSDDPTSQAFAAYLRNGERTDREHMKVLNTMSTTTGSQGGYIVPIEFSDELETATKWFGGIDGTVRIVETADGRSLQWPTVNDTANKGRYIGQNVQVTETDPAFGQVTFNSYILSSDEVLVPLALIQDSYFDIQELVTDLIGVRLGRGKNNACTVGSGSSAPTGIVTAAVSAGNVLTLATGSTTTISYNNLVDLEHSVDPSYRFKPSTFWMFNDTTLKVLKKLVDGQSRPLWQPGLSASFREGAGVDMDSIKPTILDHPYVINQDMASPAANAYSMLFGDMSKYILRQVAGRELLVLRERYADYFQVAFIGYDRHDGNLIDAGTHPVAVLQQSAS